MLKIASLLFSNSTRFLLCCRLLTEFYPLFVAIGVRSFTSTYKSIGGDSRGGESSDGGHHCSHSHDQTGKSCQSKHTAAVIQQGGLHKWKTPCDINNLNTFDTKREEPRPCYRSASFSTIVLGEQGCIHLIEMWGGGTALQCKYSLTSNSIHLQEEGTKRRFIVSLHWYAALNLHD